MGSTPTNSDKTKAKANKLAIIEAMKKSLGNVSMACKTVGINRDTYYNYLKEDEEFKQAIENEVFEFNKDFVESKLMEKINGKEYIEETKEYDKNGKIKSVKQTKKIVLPDTGAIQFFLKTKAKERGYVEKTEHDLTTNGKDLQTGIQIIVRSEEEKDIIEGI
jgi:hypothetical protein